jgi:hypothetical protein
MNLTPEQHFEFPPFNEKAIDYTVRRYHLDPEGGGKLLPRGHAEGGGQRL